MTMSPHISLRLDPPGFKRKNRKSLVYTTKLKMILMRICLCGVYVQCLIPHTHTHTHIHAHIHSLLLVLVLILFLYYKLKTEIYSHAHSLILSMFLLRVRVSRVLYLVGHDWDSMIPPNVWTSSWQSDTLWAVFSFSREYQAQSKCARAHQLRCTI
jgi:hypothetical protein